MPQSFDLAEPASLLQGMRAARKALSAGQLVVVPTDTVYGLAADAFDHAAIEALLAAKGRTRSSPPPVLVPNLETMRALAESVPTAANALVEAFWPGALTVIVRARSSLTWDLGDTRGTVALRMPSHPIALELLADTGPLAVSSANAHGEPAPHTAEEALAMLGERVAVVLDGGAVGAGYAPHEGQNGSTIVDATAADGSIRIVRHGVLPRARIAEVAGDALQGAE